MPLQRFQDRHKKTSFDTLRIACFVGFLTATGLLGAASSAHAASTAMCFDVFLRPQFTEKARLAAHQAITTDLFNGVVVDAKPFSANNNRQPIWKVVVLNHSTGRTREALFKPRPYGDADGWNRTPMEYVAYELNLMLGMDVVPPVAYRRDFVINGTTYPEGALLYLVPDAHGLRDVKMPDWGVRSDLFLSDARILDVLLENPDRHADNYLRGKHWVDGEYRPLLIDHGSSLRGNGLRLGHDNALLTGPVQKIRARTLKRLQDLKREDLNRLRGFISDREIDGIMARRDQMLRDIERLHISASNE